MHLKNFSMIESNSGWALSPAYDLLNVVIVLPEDTEELALTLAGKKLGEGLGLTPRQLNGAFNRIAENKSKVFAWIDRSFLSDSMKTAYLKVMEQRYEQLGF